MTVCAELNVNFVVIAQSIGVSPDGRDFMLSKTGIKDDSDN